MRRCFVPALAAAASLLVTVPGCGLKKVTVSGRLVKNGVVQTFAPDQYVTLQFVPVETQDGQRRSYPARIDNAAGTYDVELIAGKYRVSLFVAPPPGTPGGSAPKVGKPTGVGSDETEYDFTSSKTHDITVP
jgi:hypothetical protein